MLGAMPGRRASPTRGGVAHRPPPSAASLPVLLVAATLVLLPAAPYAQLQLDGDGLKQIQHAEFVKAVATDDAAAVGGLLSTPQGPILATMADGEEGMTALHVAAHNGAVESARLLIEAGADVNHNYNHSHNYAPLHWAAQQGQMKTLLTLLFSAADPNIRAAGGLMPLHLAAKKDHADICKALLMAGANVDGFEEFHGHHYTSLHHAAAKGHTGTIRMLMRYGANPRVVPDEEGGVSPLRLAEHEGQDAAVALIQEEMKISVGQWLRKHKLLQYVHIFMASEPPVELVEDLRVFETVQQFHDINITVPKHVAKLLRLAKKQRNGSGDAAETASKKGGPVDSAASVRGNDEAHCAEEQQVAEVLLARFEDGVGPAVNSAALERAVEAATRKDGFPPGPEGGLVRLREQAAAAATTVREKTQELVTAEKIAQQLAVAVEEAERDQRVLRQSVEQVRKKCTRAGEPPNGSNNDHDL
eukprot:COSAG05_NODE_2473_length_3019_cov_2.208904_1_plen_474_part_00